MRQADTFGFARQIYYLSDVTCLLGHSGTLYIWSVMADSWYNHDKSTLWHLCHSKAKHSNFLLVKLVVTAVCLCMAVSMPVLTIEESPADQSRTAVTAYFSSFLLNGGRYAGTRWQKRVLQLKDNQQYLLTSKVCSYRCFPLNGGQYAGTRWQKRVLQLKDKQQ